MLPITQMMGNFYPFAKQQLQFDKDASIILETDPANAQNPLGSTAHYDPASFVVTVYVDNRHPKDIMRSIAHELVHHKQNCNGDFKGIAGAAEEGYAQKNPQLREMERQAYEVGNLMFRDWEDGVKSSFMESLRGSVKKTVLTENRNISNIKNQIKLLVDQHFLGEEALHALLME